MGSPTFKNIMKTKVIIALIALIGCATNILASEPLVVDKLIHKTTDLSASNAPKDMNGNSCGLLKVITNDKSMTFEGSVVGTPEYKNGFIFPKVFIKSNLNPIKMIPCF